MDKLVFLNDTVGPCGMRIWYAPECMLQSVEGVRAAGVFIGQHEAELKAAGGVFLGIGYDAMSDGCADGSGEVFSMCQGLGVPCTLVCEDMSWGDGYAGYAAMLGVRKSLVCFVLRVSSGGMITSESAAGLRALGAAGFHVDIYYDVVSWSAAVSEVLPLDLGVCFGFGVPVWLSVSRLGDVTCEALSASVQQQLESQSHACRLFVPMFLKSYFSSFSADVKGCIIECISEDSAASFWDCDAMTRVEAGDIDAVVSEASRAVSVSSQDRFRDMESRLSRRERRAARRQLARDRKKVNQ